MLLLAMLVVKVYGVAVTMMVDPGDVAVFSDGYVTVSYSGTLVTWVIGTKTVALVVGGSDVEVIVYSVVTSTVFVSVVAIVIVLPALTVV